MTPTNRQLAFTAGLTWYQPTTACPKCGSLALRRVVNGSCAQCEANYRAARQSASPNDRVVSRADAMAAGMLKYRTGKPCRAGHTGWRYVSTRACVDCRKSASE